jgi:hypothetical protein
MLVRSGIGLLSEIESLRRMHEHQQSVTHHDWHQPDRQSSIISSTKAVQTDLIYRRAKH